MPSVSKKQQNFFRLVKAVKAGKVKKKDVDDKVRKAAKSMTKKEVSDFADHLEEQHILSFEEFLENGKDGD